LNTDKSLKNIAEHTKWLEKGFLDFSNPCFIGANPWQKEDIMRAVCSFAK